MMNIQLLKVAKRATAAMLITAFYIVLPGRCLADDVWLVVVNETCGNANGSIEAQYSSEVLAQPVTYEWSNGVTTRNNTGLAAGSYSVMLTDALGSSYWAQADVLDVPYLTGVGGGSYYIQTGEFNYQNGVACPGQCNGSRSFAFVDGTGPYTFSWTDPGVSYLSSYAGHPAYTGFCHDATYDYTVTDTYGCPGSGSFTADLIDPTAEPFIISVEGACGGGANGSLLVDQNFGWFQGYTTSIGLYQNGVSFPSSPIFQGSGVWLFSGLPPGQYAYRQDAGSLSEPSQCALLIPFVIEDLGSSCGNVSGTLFLDHGQDCQQDAIDPGIAYRVIDIGPGADLAITNADGRYTRNLPLGAYTLLPQGNDLFPLCPSVSPAPFDLTVDAPLAVIDLADSSLIDLDIAAWLQAGPARPGFIHTVIAEARNNSGQLSGPLHLTLTFDPLLSFLSATPIPSTVAGNTVTWSGLAPMNGYGAQHVQVDLQVPPDAGLIGTPVQHSFSVSQSLLETALANNATTLSGIIGGSFDPNEKVATTSSNNSAELYLIEQDEWIEYAIRFQNTGTDTAFTVTVTDTLSPSLDMATFEQGIASHAFTMRFRPDRVIEWKFQNIQLPDSNVNEPRSHGSVSFRIRPQQPVAPGTSMVNTANIFFDFNAPVITEPSVLTAEFTTGVPAHPSDRSLWLLPNPTSGSLEVRVSGAAASGVLHVVSVDGRMVLERRMEGPRMVLDVSGLARGLYTLNWNGANGATTTQRFVRE
ncbi:MAG: T9SS type A sorting domain-containing protein [Flavobacteriales bacterium]